MKGKDFLKHQYWFGFVCGFGVCTLLIMLAFWNLDTCSQGYECTKIVEPEFAGSAYIQNGCVIWNGSEGYDIIFKSVNGTQIPRCSEALGQ